ncbi:sugar phosphate isomerase/epimerase [Algoriphagus boseongensis]|uniref:Sugar phosphate isomerase/epimerase n=1 Tax=Algoriphagus boseongensis TaxID=1442587 RepID=A0A4R6T2V4_9BACT|nr:sugar phosphate isomerase/epimerase family protein [Algoriphagus boseongensis]TDQ16286.1 sugar phosphate isomerase/epimerase [Algoriphagus boseongensis]
MILSAATIALVPQIKTGPWIFWDDLESSMEKASQLGFDGVELFTESADSLDPDFLQKNLEKHSLKLAAVGTGAGKVIHGLTLTDPNPEIREKAISFISDMISLGAKFGAPAIIGSMQGNVPQGGDREKTLDFLREGLEILGEKAGEVGVFLIYEPLNRYETNLLNTLEAGAKFLDSLKTRHVRLLADLFHMNIEETNLPDSLRKYGKFVGHVHLADSHRGPIGSGHTSFEPIASVLKEIGYSGFVSAEAFPWPDSESAAKMTIDTFLKNF